MPETLPLVASLGQIALTVTDLARATSFYRDILGLPFLFEASHMAFFDCAGVRLMLTIPETPQPPGNSILYYRTDDIQAACARLQAGGVTLDAPARRIARMPDHDLWMAFFRDSEGNLLALMSEVRGGAEAS
ncbi:MAG: VOC family protein [Acidobacteriota bacterium]